MSAARRSKAARRGLFEFRLREENVLLRVFCHAHGSKIVLPLSGYDKGGGAEAAGSLAAASGPFKLAAVADMS